MDHSTHQVRVRELRVWRGALNVPAGREGDPPLALRMADGELIVVRGARHILDSRRQRTVKLRIQESGSLPGPLLQRMQEEALPVSKLRPMPGRAVRAVKGS